MGPQRRPGRQIGVLRTLLVTGISTLSAYWPTQLGPADSAGMTTAGGLTPDMDEAPDALPVTR